MRGAVLFLPPYVVMVQLLIKNEGVTICRGHRPVLSVVNVLNWTSVPPSLCLFWSDGKVTGIISWATSCGQQSQWCTQGGPSVAPPVTRSVCSNSRLDHTPPPCHRATFCPGTHLSCVHSIIVYTPQWSVPKNVGTYLPPNVSASNHTGLQPFYSSLISGFRFKFVFLAGANLGLGRLGSCLGRQI